MRRAPHASLKTAGASWIPKVPPLVHEVLGSPGRSLDTAMRTAMASRFGHDFSQIRVHADAKAAESARQMNASAYTVGQVIVFGQRRYAPETAAGRRLLAHELTHTIQQRANDGAMRPGLALGDPADRLEKEADAVAGRVLAGAPAQGVRTTAGPLVQRQPAGGDPGKKPPEKKDAGDVIVEGLKTVVEQAKDNNPKVKKVIIDPLKRRAEGEWNRLGTGGKAATIGFGAASLGLAGGALLSDPGGRKLLEGVNLASPFTLIPYMPLSSFKYTLPSGDTPEKRLYTFETGFNADDLINLYTKPRGLPKMSLRVNMRWGYDPTGERLTILGGDAALGLVPGLSLSAGAYKDVLRMPPTFIGPEGRMTQIRKSIPEFGKPSPIPDVRIMLTVDLLKFKPGDLKRQIEHLF